MCTALHQCNCYWYPFLCLQCPLVKGMPGIHQQWLRAAQSSNYCNDWQRIADIIQQGYERETYSCCSIYQKYSRTLFFPSPARAGEEYVN